MNKRFYLVILWMLFIASSLSLRAQSLSRLEYWFDRNYSSREYISLSGYEDDVVRDVSTSGLSSGLHWLHIRCLDGDGTFSGITSSPFFKADPADGNILEYWFDEDYENRESMEIAVPTGVTELTPLLAMRDPNKFPIGFHQVNFRLTNSAGHWSPVSSAFVMRVGGGVAQSIEYWIDDDLENSRFVEGTPIDDGSISIYESIDLGDTSMGLHTFNCRPASASGRYVGAVSSTPIFVVGGGKTTVEYWLDDDVKSAKQLSASTIGKRHFVASHELNLGDVAPGLHYIHYRATSETGQRLTAIGSSPIMVKSMYAPDKKENVTVSKVRIWVDDENGSVSDVLDASSTVEITRNLDVRKFGSGDHIVSVQAANSNNIWSDVYHATFNQEELPAPEIALSATILDDLVQLSFNSIPNDISYRLVRYDASGTGSPVKIRDYDKVGGGKRLMCTDNPVSGTYVYQVQCRYTDREGNSITLRSNQVKLTLETTRQEVDKLATVYGRVVFSNLKTGELPQGKSRTVILTYKDKNGNNKEISLLTDNVGKFSQEGLPFRTKIQATVMQDGFYNYDSQEFLIAPEVNNGVKQIILKGTIREDLPDNLTFDEPDCDLFINSNYIIDGGMNLKFQVKNSTDKQWQGLVRIKATRIHESLVGNYAELVANAFYSMNNSSQSESKQLTLKAGEQQLVSIPLFEISRMLDIPKDDIQYYDLLIEYKSSDVKKWYTMGVNKAFNVTNPTSQAIKGQVEWTNKTIYECVKEIVEYMKDVDKVKKYMNYGIQIDKLLADVEIATYLPDDVDPQKYFIPAREEAVLFESVYKNLVKVIKTCKTYTEPLKYVKMFYEERDNFLDIFGNGSGNADNTIKRKVTPMEQYFAKINFIWKFVEKYANNPYASLYGKMLSTYTAVGNALAEKASNFTNYLNEANISNIIREGRLTIGFHDFDNNKVPISKSKLNPTKYNDYKVILKNDIIRSAKIEQYSIDESNRTDKPQKEFSCQISVDEENRLKFQADVDNFAINYYILSIVWSNGRVSKIPLIKCEEYDMNLEDIHGTTYISVEYKVESPTNSSEFANFLHLEKLPKKIK